MILEFTHEFKILTVTSATELELEMLQNTATEKSYNFIKKTEYTKCLMSNWRLLPAGLWSDVLKLKKTGWNVTITNLDEFVRSDVSRDEFYEWVDSVPLSLTPYKYQTESAFRMYRYRTSRLQIGTGGGKSLAQYLLARYLLDKCLPKDHIVLLVVPKVMLCTQMQNDFYTYQTDDFITVDKVYGGSKRTPNANIVVGNIDSLVNMPSDFFNNVGAVLFDEAHKMKTAGYQTVMQYLPQHQIHTISGVSGTFHTRNTIEGLVESAYLGPIVVDIPLHELTKLGSITPVKVDVIKLNYDSIYSHGYYHLDNIDKPSGRYKLEVDYIQSLSQRFSIITSVVQRVTGNQILLFNTRAYAKMFEQYLLEHATDREVFRIVGGIADDIRTGICNRLEEISNGIVCATYATLDTGVSIKNVHHLHMIDDTKSFIRVRQSIGRTVRLHESKEFAHIFDWVDVFRKQRPTKKNPNVIEWPGPATNIMSRHSKERISIYDQQKIPYKLVKVDVAHQ